LKHPFIKKAKRNNHLIDLIDRFRKWKLTHSADSDSESDSDADQTNHSDDSDWNLTVKGSVSPYIEQFENSIALEKENDDRDKKTSIIVTSQNNVVELNRDVEVKNSHRHNVTTTMVTSNGAKIQNGSTPPSAAVNDVVISPKRQPTHQSSHQTSQQSSHQSSHQTSQQSSHQTSQQASPSKEKSSPHRSQQTSSQQPHRSPATPATKSELNIVSFFLYSKTLFIWILDFSPF
jgi:serine/threonine-protein kinase 24/25/MST4